MVGLGASRKRDPLRGHQADRTQQARDDGGIALLPEPPARERESARGARPALLQPAGPRLYGFLVTNRFLTTFARLLSFRHLAGRELWPGP